jgi:hypothetical protein
MLRIVHFRVLSLFAFALMLGGSWAASAVRSVAPRSALGWQAIAWGGVAYVGLLQVLTLAWVGSTDPRYPPRPAARNLLLAFLAFGLSFCAFVVVVRVFRPNCMA